MTTMDTVETKWTKGPWKAHEYNLRMGSLISHGDISKGQTIANVFAQRNVEEGEANGRLVAAAPELYEALLACQLQLLQSNNDSEYAREANDLANAALLKAKGSDD